MDNLPQMPGSWNLNLHSTFEEIYHTISFSSVVIVACLRLQLTRCKASRTQMYHNNVFPRYPLISQKLLCNWRERFVQRYNLGSCNHEMRAIHQIQRASVVAWSSTTALRPLAQGPFEQLVTVSHTIHKRRPHVAPATNLGRRMGIAQSDLLWKTWKSRLISSHAIS